MLHLRDVSQVVQVRRPGKLRGEVNTFKAIGSWDMAETMQKGILILRDQK